MPKLEKTLQGDLEEIHDKLSRVICAMCEKTIKRGTWDTAVDNVSCKLTVFEKQDKQIWDAEKNEWKNQPHHMLTLNLIDTGKEIRLFAITAGGSRELYFNPDPSGEGELMGALKTALEILDNII